MVEGGVAANSTVMRVIIRITVTQQQTYCAAAYVSTSLRISLEKGALNLITSQGVAVKILKTENTAKREVAYFKCLM